MFPRTNDKEVGKGYALDYGLPKSSARSTPTANTRRIFVFDADNVLDVNYFREMNKTFDNGAKASTTLPQFQELRLQLDLGRLRACGSCARRSS